MVDTRRPRAPRPPVRLRPAPPLDPPCIDDDPAWSHAGQLALDLVDPRRREPDRPANRAPDRAPGWPRWSSAGPPAGCTPPGAADQAAPDVPAATPEAARAAYRFIRTFLEIVNGFRPPGQLRPLCLPEAVSTVSAELTRAARRVTPVRRRTARPTLHLRRLRVCEPRAGAVEATAVFLGAGGTSWAVAVRLERHRGNWFCLVLDVL
ncbi:Rv3235 family protein [Micromonospora sp. WMMD998]|uniref:Rv3235 family protein n=1 Tax=Micromonospora sp. WMMD998 TaxID=3016092 RepID=UPI002499DD41|nr:Rv3235 family protein [Micromonospora sp. WMMD998]WFE38563.1 Rv3235 family protein [Micromonospora sp. WMMD998]